MAPVTIWEEFIPLHCIVALGPFLGVIDWRLVVNGWQSPGYTEGDMAKMCRDAD